jgi:hypothetical protein
MITKAFESHSKFTGHKAEVLTSELSEMIDDADRLTALRFKTKENYPRYIINRLI